MLDKIAKLAGFDYEMYISPDSMYGAQRDDGVWTGMIGEVVRRVSEICLANEHYNEKKSSINLSFSLHLPSGG